jgi:hypothetical protein
VLVREAGDSVCVKDDRETNAIECLVMAANMVAWSRMFIGSCSRCWCSNPLLCCCAIMATELRCSSRRRRQEMDFRDLVGDC